MPNNIQTIIDKFREEVSNGGMTFKVVEQFLKDSLISMLDGIEKEAKDLDYYTQTTLSSKKVNLSIKRSNKYN